MIVVRHNQLLLSIGVCGGGGAGGGGVKLLSRAMDPVSDQITPK